MTKTFLVTSEKGIHAENATKLVYAANQYDSEVFLKKEEVAINLKSIMGTLSLDVEKDDEFLLIVEGNDEVEAMDRLCEIISELKIAIKI